MSFKPKILVLESEDSIRALVEATLERMGAIPLGYTSAQEGAEILEQEKFDGAFVDWDNFDLPGEDFARRVRHSASNSQIPIAMFTATTDTRVIAEAFKAGVTLFLSKPFGARELERLLNVCRGTMLEERRRYQRVVLSTPVVCEWGKKRGFKRISGRTVNISNSGLLMRLYPQPDLGTVVVSELILPNSRRSLKLEGTVVRTGTSRQVAVQFSHLTANQRDLLEDYIGGPETEAVESGWIRN
jgi:DNA-binding response OmpR family regulator